MISTEIKANPNPSISVALAKKNKACIPFLSLIPPSQFAKTEKTYKQKKKPSSYVSIPLTSLKKGAGYISGDVQFGCFGAEY